MTNNNLWWGYLHSNNTVQVKRWFGDHKDYRDDCHGNPFVIRVVEPFEASTREEAYQHIREEVGLAPATSPASSDENRKIDMNL